MFYVYVLKSERDRDLYIGYTEDLKRRLGEHNGGANKSIKSRKPFVLIYYEAYRDKSDAIIRERRLKQFKNSYSELRKRIVKSIR